MEKGRWIIGTLLLIGLLTVGRKRMEPLWDKAVHDPALGLIFVIVFLLLIVFIIRVIRH